MAKIVDSPAPAEGGGGALSPAKKTPTEWAQECGHVDAGLRMDPKFGPVLAKGASRKALRGWIFKATAAREGWGTTKPIDVLMTRADYEAAVAAAMGVSLGRAER